MLWRAYQLKEALRAVFAGDLPGRHEGLNNKIRTMTRRADGLHSPEAALALVMLTCGPTTLTLPNHTAPHPHSRQKGFSCWRRPAVEISRPELS